MTLTVTDVVEYAFCPKFTYFINILRLSQFEQKRGTVSAGRKLHTKHEKNNLRYFPQGLKGKKITKVIVVPDRLVNMIYQVKLMKL